MKKLFTIALLILATSTSSLFSQNYLREAGFRGGLTSGITFRQYLHESLSYEGILSFRKSGLQFTLLRQVHEENPAFNLPENFRFLYGFGGHAGYYFSDVYHPFGFTEFQYPQRKFSPLLGVDAYAGIEYRFDTFPVVLGLDYKPFFEFSLYQYFNLRVWDVALTAKYRF